MPRQSWWFLRWATIGLSFMLLVGSGSFITPTLAQDDPVTVVASGLINPRGIARDDDGNLYVALAGTGGVPESAGVPAEPGSSTAAVATIESGCAVDIVTGLPSGGLPDLGWVFGVSELEYVDSVLYALVDGGGEAWDNADQPNGLYRVGEAGALDIVVDLGAWLRANPVAELHEPINPDGEWFGMVAGDGGFWVVEANHEQVVWVTLDGTVERIADFSPLGNVAPSGVALAPDGGAYVSFLSALPFADGSSKVVHVSAAGEITDHWSGLTAVTALAVDEVGELYALEMATGNIADAPFVAPGTGKVVRRTGPDSAEDVVTGLDFPVKLEFDATGALDVVGPAFGANHGEGYILRISILSGGVVDVPRDLPIASTCRS